MFLNSSAARKVEQHTPSFHCARSKLSVPYLRYVLYCGLLSTHQPHSTQRDQTFPVIYYGVRDFSFILNPRKYESIDAINLSGKVLLSKLNQIPCTCLAVPSFFIYFKFLFEVDHFLTMRINRTLYNVYALEMKIMVPVSQMCHFFKSNRARCECRTNRTDLRWQGTTFRFGVSVATGAVSHSICSISGGG